MNNDELPMRAELASAYLDGELDAAERAAAAADPEAMAMADSFAAGPCRAWPTSRRSPTTSDRLRSAAALAEFDARNDGNAGRGRRSRCRHTAEGQPCADLPAAHRCRRRIGDRCGRASPRSTRPETTPSRSRPPRSSAAPGVAATESAQQPSLKVADTGAAAETAAGQADAGSAARQCCGHRAGGRQPTGVGAVRRRQQRGRRQYVRGTAAIHGTGSRGSNRCTCRNRSGAGVAGSGSCCRVVPDAVVSATERHRPRSHHRPGYPGTRSARRLHRCDAGHRRGQLHGVFLGRRPIARREPSGSAHGPAQGPARCRSTVGSMSCRVIRSPIRTGPQASPTSSTPTSARCAPRSPTERSTPCVPWCSASSSPSPLPVTVTFLLIFCTKLVQS